MDVKKAVQIVIIVGALGAAGYIAAKNLSKPSYSEDTSGGEWLHWICSKCQHQWSGTVAEMEEAAKQNHGVHVCPQCSQESAVIAYMCRACGKIVPSEGHGVEPVKCKYCGASF